MCVECVGESDAVVVSVLLLLTTERKRGAAECGVCRLRCWSSMPIELVVSPRFTPHLRTVPTTVLLHRAALCSSLVDRRAAQSPSSPRPAVRAAATQWNTERAVHGETQERSTRTHAQRGRAHADTNATHGPRDLHTKGTKEQREAREGKSTERTKAWKHARHPTRELIA